MALTVFAWFHGRGNSLVEHNLVILGHITCALNCGFDLIIGDMARGETSNQGKLGVNFKGLIPGGYSEDIAVGPYQLVFYACTATIFHTDATLLDSNKWYHVGATISQSGV